MSDKLDDYARRPMRYQNIDGIWEMGLGFLWLAAPLLEKSLRGAPSRLMKKSKRRLLCRTAAIVSSLFSA